MYAEPPSIAVCIAATGSYISFANQFIESARKLFLPECSVTYFVFTDSPISAQDIIWVYQCQQQWPFSTMMRFEMYAGQQEALSQFDYVFAIDADMLCVSCIGNEILVDSIGVAHPGFASPRKGVLPSFESNTESLAYLPESKRGGIYFAGAFFGGSCDQFIKIVKTCSQNIREDLKKGIVALYHDESHLNCYFRKYPPSKILSPSYCYTSSNIKARAWKIHGKFPKKILCLEKDHTVYQR